MVETSLLQPLLADALALHRAGELARAQAVYQQILSLDPEHADAMHLMGVLAQQRGDTGAAQQLIEQAIDLNGAVATYHANLGAVLRERGRLEEAVGSYERALALDPALANAWSNLGSALRECGEPDRAVECCERALQLQPVFPQAWSNLGSVMADQGRLAAAASYYQKALAVSPDYPEALYNLGNVRMEQARHEEAIELYTRALALRSGYRAAFSNLLFCLNYHGGVTPQQVLDAHQLWDRRFAGAITATHANNPDLGRKLRVGYVSPDFRRHSVAFFVEPLFEAFDAGSFEVFCYSQVAQPDAVTRRLQSLVPHWRDTTRMGDAEMAELIRADGIDILVDLAGHTAGNRLQVFSAKPAPVQINWLGYPHSTGLRAMDYRIVDAISDPPDGGVPSLTTEKLLRLAHGFLCYKPPPVAPKPCDPPLLRNGYVTFGSFNNPSKLSIQAIEAWAQVLREVKGSRLLLKGKAFSDAATRDALVGQFGQRGIAAQRINILGMLDSVTDHLSLYNDMDIALDPFPYNGATTTCEALWMGVPVVCLMGDRHAARVGASLLTHIGRSEWVAASAKDYVGRAVQLAGDPAALMHWRSMLRDTMAGSRLCDKTAFAREMEANLRHAWTAWCAAQGAGG